MNGFIHERGFAAISISQSIFGDPDFTENALNAEKSPVAGENRVARYPAPGPDNDDTFMTFGDSQYTMLEHGGNLAAAVKLFGGTPQEWIDLSTGINPNPYPVPCVPASAWHGLPDQEALETLLRQARQYYRASDSLSIVAAPGTQAIIQCLPHLVTRPTTVAVVSPTYGEHANVWRSHGHCVVTIESLTELPDAATITVVVNPNNPDGRVHGPDELMEMASVMSVRGGFLVVDEAFCDVSPDLSLASREKAQGLVILKSFGKFFGLAGLRLGFALGDNALVRRLTQLSGPWAVSGPALHIGTVALSDNTWAGKTRDILARERCLLEGTLSRNGLGLIGATDLFVLASHPCATRLYTWLGQCKILVRPFEDQPDRIRFGMPRDQGQRQSLEKCLASFTATIHSETS